MITVSNIQTACLSLLRAEDSDRYPFDIVFVPAINLASKWMMSLFEKLFARKQVNENVLSDLHKLKVYQTSIYSRVAVPNDGWWSITGIHPKIVCTNPNAVVDYSTEKSKYLSIYAVDKILKSATRLTVEEWARKEQNPVIPGSSLITNEELQDYAYLGPIHAKNNSYGTLEAGEDREIIISPDIGRALIAISYLDYPEVISEQSDTISFPASMEEMMVQKTLHFISILENVSDRDLTSVTQAELDQAIQLLL